MLNRATWVQYSYNEHPPIPWLKTRENLLDLHVSKNHHDGDIVGWCCQQEIRTEEDTYSNIINPLDWNHVLLSKVTSSSPWCFSITIVQMGAYCKKNHQVKAISRLYDEKGLLILVLFQEGIAVSCD